MGNVAKAQLKITAITFHYTLLGVMGLVTVTYFDRNYFDAVINYIVCQSNGKQSCQEELPNLDEILVLATIIILLSLLPVVVIMFSCDLQAFKKKRQPRSKTMSTISHSRSYLKRSSVSQFSFKQSSTRQFSTKQSSTRQFSSNQSSTKQSSTRQFPTNQSSTRQNSARQLL